MGRVGVTPLYGSRPRVLINIVRIGLGRRNDSPTESRVQRVRFSQSVDHTSSWYSEVCNYPVLYIYIDLNKIARADVAAFTAWYNPYLVTQIDGCLIELH